jgi:endonuclease YncB( thermonuclease family)
MRLTLIIALTTMMVLAGSANAQDRITGAATMRDAVTVAIAGARFRLDSLVSSEAQTCSGKKCAEVASDVIGPRLAGHSVTCTKEHRLGHGYFLARCKLDDGVDLATLILEEGLATHEPNAPGSYREAVEKAKVQGRGLWSR